MIARRTSLGMMLGLAGMSAAGQEAPTLNVSTNNAPADRKALQLLGEEAFRRAGLTLRLTSLPSERSLFAANAGEVDGEGLRMAGLESSYPNLVRVPEHFVSISFVAFARDSRIRVDRGWASLKPHRVAFLNGWKIFESNASEARSVTKVETAEQLFRMLEHDRVDLALYTRTDGLALTRQLGLNQIKALSPALADTDMYVYLHRRHQALLPRIALALRNMKADGTHARLLSSLTGP